MWIVRPNHEAFNLNSYEEIWVNEQDDRSYIVFDSLDKKHTKTIPFDTKELAIQSFHYLVQAWKRNEGVIYL